MRMSTAAPYSHLLDFLIPGMGIKFLRDGVDSANTVAMNSVNGQESWNYFLLPWSNHILDMDNPILNPLAEKFHEATEYIQAMGLSDMAMWDQYGNQEYPRFPFKLRFEPQLSYSEEYTDGILYQLKKIEEGTTIWKVYGWDAPEDFGGEEHFIGDITTTSRGKKSKYGDDMLFFRHQRSEDDIGFKPEWKEYYPSYKLAPEDGSVSEDECLFHADIPDSTGPGCPFAFLLQ